MKTIPIALLIVLCVALAGEAQAQKRVTFVGISTATTLGNAGGLMAMHALCQAAHGKKARMCTTQDLIAGLGSKTPLSNNPWIQVVPVLVYGNDDTLDVTGFRLSSNPPNCNGWLSNSGEGVFASGANFALNLTTCNGFRPVACCK